MSDLAFGILGDLVARGPEGEIRIGGRRRRALLAYLLLHRGQRVSLDRLCDDLWAGSPPASAEATVRTYVSQIRRLPVYGAGLSVTADPGGYVIEVESDQVDASVFERLLEEAAESVGSARVSLLESALALIRGTPLSEFDGAEWADSAARRFQLLTATARQDRFEALLELGEHDGCIADLDRDARAAPLDEKLAALLALARYRSGDVAGSLRALTEVRQSLAEELGLSPGPEIIELEIRILERDAGLSIPASRLERASPPPVVELPTGTVTFLFTDIEGSTALLHRIGDHAYVNVLQTHRAVLEAAISGNDGVVFGSEGDALFAAFASAESATAAAVAAQRGLAGQDWDEVESVAVRMGIHTGATLLVDDDYAGATVHVAARVSAAAHGGQIVMSDAAHVLAGAPAHRDLGLHRLKDVAQPMRLYQIVAAGIEEDFPALRTTQDVPHNLPDALDAYIGRENDHARLVDASASHRHVTVVGPGGVGKTRLVTEFGRASRPSYSGGVFLVELASISDRATMEAAIAAAADVSMRAGQTIENALGEVAAGVDTLLVLDNCEHLIGEVADVVSTVLVGCETISIVCTSREPLDVRGERVLRLEPLAIDGSPIGLSPAERLFVERVESATGRTPADADLPHIRAVCRDLDGLPLAIELAASRCRGLAIADIARRLEDRFALLRTSRDVNDRHGTLEAVIGWSYENVSPEDRRLLTRVAFLGDGFTIDAAAAVAERSFDDVADGLLRLVDKSLVSFDNEQGASSYRFLESIRAFCRERMREPGESGGVIGRVIEWTLSWVERLEADMRTDRQDESLRAVMVERSTIRVGLTELISQGRDIDALRVVASVPIGAPAERIRLIDQLVDSVDDRVVSARALSAASNLSFERSDYASSADYGARCRALFAELGDSRSAAWADFISTFSIWAIGDEVAARETITRSLDTFRELEDEVGIANVSWCAALLAIDDAESEALAAEAEGLLRRIDMPTALAHCLESGALAKIRMGNAVDALDPLVEALGVFSAARNPGCTAHCLAAVAAAAVSETVAPEVVAELLGAADELRERSGHGHRPWELGGRQAAAAVLAERLDESTREEAFASGRQHTLDSAVDLARRIVEDRKR